MSDDIIANLRANVKELEKEIQEIQDKHKKLPVCESRHSPKVALDALIKEVAEMEASLNTFCPDFLKKIPKLYHEECKMDMFDTVHAPKQNPYSGLPLSQQILLRKCDALLQMINGIDAVCDVSRLGPVLNSVTSAKKVLQVKISPVDAAKIRRSLNECENVIMGQRGDIVSAACLDTFYQELEKQPQ